MTQLGVKRLDVVSPDQIQVCRHNPVRRIEESLMHRIGIRAANQTQGGDVVRRHHSRVARMELFHPTLARQLAGDLVDALGDYQDGPVECLGEKITERPIETPRQHYPLAFLRYQGKGAVDVKNRIHVTSEQPAPGLRFVGPPEAL